MSQHSSLHDTEHALHGSGRLVALLHLMKGGQPLGQVVILVAVVEEV